jgi:bacterial/archaeal transporter family-2 protein
MINLIESLRRNTMNNLISAFIGALISIMILFNGALSSASGNYTASIIIHIIGLVSITLVVLVSKSKINFKKGLPLYLYSAGAVGVFTVLFNNLSFKALGVSLPLALGLLGQSFASMIIDHYGFFGMKIIKFERKKYIGLIFIILGIIVMTIF